jgi:hypothetical protein
MDDLAGSAEADVVVHVVLAEAAAVHGLGALDNAEHRLRERRRRTRRSRSLVAAACVDSLRRTGCRRRRTTPRGCSWKQRSCDFGRLHVPPCAKPAAVTSGADVA